jgi:hypothetical protein
VSDIDRGLRAASEKLKKILAKRNRGEQLNAAEETFLAVAQGKPIAAAGAALPHKAAGMAHAVALLQSQFPQLTKPLLRQLKQQPEFRKAFDGANRVIVTELVPLLAAHFANPAPATAAPPKVSKLDLECRRIEHQARKVKAEADAIEKLSVERSAVIASNRRVCSELRKLLRKLETEMPGEVTGRDLEHNRKYGAALYDELCEKIGAWESEWPE